MKTNFIKTCATAFALLVGMSGAAVAQSKLLRAIDYAQFKYDSVSTEVEIYAAISPSSLLFQKVNNKSGAGDSTELVSNAKLEFRLENLATGSVSQVSSEIPVRMPDTSTIAQDSRIVSITKILADTGRYRLTALALEGKSSTPVDSFQTFLEVTPYPRSELSVSSIELCSAISQAASKDDPYYKNTLHVVPNPEDTYGTGIPSVSYYAEIYGLGSRNDSTEYNISWSIVDTYGRTVKRRSTLKSGISQEVVEIGSTNISNLPSGRYALDLSVADSTTKKMVSTTKYFFIYNPYVKQPEVAAGSDVNVLSSPFYQMGLKQLDDVFYAANYLESPQQTTEYKKIKTIEGKRRFLADFWAAENRKAGPNGFNSWRSFDERFKYADIKFKTAFKRGWLTDRGRVYIDYGRPDEIDRHPSSSSSKPYEVWTYNSIQGGVIFVFVDLTGFNDYELIHSTMQGEVSDPDWQRYVQLQQQ